MGDSGHFVLARWTQEDKTEIEMTAFKVSMMTMTAGKMVLQWFLFGCFGLLWTDWISQWFFDRVFIKGLLLRPCTQTNPTIGKGSKM